MLIVTSVATGTTDITIDYRIDNQHASDLYVFAVLFHTARNGTQSDDPTLAYAGKTSAGRVVIGKFLVTVPQGHKAAVAESPYLVKLAPRQSVVGQVVVPVPLTLRHPYLQSPVDAPVAESVEHLILRVSFLDAATFPPNAAVVSPATGRAGLFKCDYGFASALQAFFDAPVDLAPPGVPSRL